MATMSIGGLASGLDTDAIIAQMMAIEKRPRILLGNKQVLIETRQALLKEIQSKLKSLQVAAADLRSVALYAPKQTVESGDPTRIGVTASAGAPVGGYQVEVTQLANAAQRTFSFTSPAADGTITIDGHVTHVTAGMTAQELATAINSDRDAKVYAAAIDDGTIVFSSRETGDHRADPVGDPDGFIAVTDATGALVEQAGRARAGRDAQYVIDGVARTSKTNVVTDGLAGVTLTLRGVTTTTGPVTISVGAPEVDAEAIKGKLEAFVEAYNATVELIRSKLDERRVPDTRTAQEIANGVPDTRTSAERKAGQLFGDRQLSSLLVQLRHHAYATVPGAPSGMDSLAALGISTGAASTSTSPDALAGKLTIDVDRLMEALTDDPLAVRELLAGVDNAGGWARGFEALVDQAAGTDGILSMRIDGTDDELRHLTRQMEMFDQRLSVRERSLRAQFAALETALAKSQAQGAWLSAQLAGLSSNAVR